MVVRDDRNSFYHVLGIGPAGRVVSCSRGAKHLAEFGFEEGYDWFVTRNGFSSRKSREAAYCRQLNSFLFDIDVHGGGADAEYSVALAVQLLESAWAAGKIPEPTMAVFTGRGLQLYYALERSTTTRLRDGSRNRRGEAYFNDVYRKLASAIGGIVRCVPDAELDRAVFDASRVSRVPGTVNSKCGKTCRVIHDSGIFHTLKGINEALPSGPREMRGKSGGGGWRRKGGYSSLAKIRMEKVEELRDYREVRGGCDGKRELMCFVYHNAAVQLFADPEDAYEATSRFNAGFSDPVDQREVDNIRKSVAKVGFYMMSSAKIAAFLGLTDEEAYDTSFFATKRDIERQKTKDETRERRRRRDAGIAFLEANKLGARQIADAMGCCVRTVYNARKGKGEGESTIGLREATRLLLEVVRPLKPEPITTNNKSAAKNLQRGDHSETPDSLGWAAPVAAGMREGPPGGL